jgi:hypothetical protein
MRASFASSSNRAATISTFSAATHWQNPSYFYEEEREREREKKRAKEKRQRNKPIKINQAKDTHMEERLKGEPNEEIKIMQANKKGENIIFFIQPAHAG